ncbi:hypothetical protein SRABI80_04727 [Peribacillus frigoritolerans]|nr:hypothetical protein SRABI80_04727 [Peribacillus frigoritolerans]
MFLGVTGNIYNPYFPKHFFYGAAFSLLAFGLSNVEKHALINKSINFIGKISFSMYLVHFFVLDILDTLLAPKLLNLMTNSAVLGILFILTLLISTIFSYLSFRFIETPGINIGRNLSSMLKNKGKKEPLKAS